MKFIAKNILTIIITLLTFSMASRVVGGTGNMPQSLIDAYGDSVFVKNGMRLPALISLCTIIMVFLLINFYFIRDGIHCNKYLKGLIYGSTFGVLWFFGFMELIVIFQSGGISHIKSSIRDFISLLVFGLISGALLCKSESVRISRNSHSLAVIPFVAVFFALFHGAQYYFTFEPIHLRITDCMGVLWLLALGIWIGFMYYLFEPGIRFKNKYWGMLFFSFSVFGTNWLLYNLFYNIFLDIPFWDVFIRCFTGCAGVFIGLAAYEILLGSKYRMTKIDELSLARINNNESKEEIQ